MDLFGNTGTIFDSPYFYFERPAFERIANESDEFLTMALILGAIVLCIVALYPRSPTILKAIVLAWIILP